MTDLMFKKIYEIKKNLTCWHHLKNQFWKGDIGAASFIATNFFAISDASDFI